MSAPKRARLVIASLIAVAAVANPNLAVANVALPSIGRAFDALRVVPLLPRAELELQTVSDPHLLLGGRISMLGRDGPSPLGHADHPSSSVVSRCKHRRILGETISGRQVQVSESPAFAGLSWAGQDSNLRSSDYELRARRAALLTSGPISVPGSVLSSAEFSAVRETFREMVSSRRRDDCPRGRRRA